MSTRMTYNRAVYAELEQARQLEREREIEIVVNGKRVPDMGAALRAMLGCVEPDDVDDDEGDLDLCWDKP